MDLSSETFEAEVLKSDIPVVVDFWAEWCPPCKALNPTIKQLAEELAGRIKILKVDVEQHEPLALQHSVQSFPTLVLFRNGQEVARRSGWTNRGTLLRWIEENTSP